MNIKDIISYVEQFSEISEKEKEYLTSFITDNKDKIIIDSEVVEGAFCDDYYNVTVDGPNNFYLVFEKGCNTDHLSLLELDFNEISIF